MRRMLGSALVGAIALVLVNGAHAGPQISDFQAKREKGQALLLGGLVELSDWCRKEKLFQAREGVLLRILALDPDHAESRKALGFRKDRDGGWTPPKRPRTFKDFDEDALAEFPAREAAALADSLAHYQGLLADPAITLDQREVLSQDLLSLDPDNAELRAARGEVKSGARWIMRETVAAKARRTRLASVVEQGLRTLPEAAEPRPRDAAISLPWTGAVRVPSALVVGTVPRGELEKVATHVEAAVGLLREVLGRNVQPPEDLAVVLLEDGGQGAQYLEGCKELTDEARAALQGVAGAWLTQTNEAAYWTEREDQRLDGVIRLIVKHVLEQAHFVTVEQAWIHEGFGLYLTEAVTGTRHTWFAPAMDPEGMGAEQSLRRELVASEDWLELARQVFGAADEPLLEGVLTRQMPVFTSRDLVVSYALSAYLIECHADRVELILGKVCGGIPAFRVFEKELGRDLAELDRRIPRWLDQMAELKGGTLTIEAFLLQGAQD